MDEEILGKLSAAVQVDVKYGLSHAEAPRDRPRLPRHLGRAGSGLDNIDAPYATRRASSSATRPRATSSPPPSTLSACSLDSSRNIPWADRFIKSGKWGRSQFEGSDLYAKTLGIIGLGRIGSLVSQRARGFAMRVIAYDPYIPYSRFSNLNVERKDKLDELLGESDYITIHTPRTKETLDMISDKEIAMMKPGVRLVDCARGGLYNEEALYRGLKSGHIASLGVDTWVHEPQDSHPLYV